MTPSMLDYILRQPDILQKTYSERDAFLEPLHSMFQTHSIKRIYFFGSGTSYHVSRLGAMYFSRILNLECSAHEPILFADCEAVNPSDIYGKDEVLAVGVSQSGTSRSTMEALEKAKRCGCLTMCFSQEKESPAVRESDGWLPMVCEKELVPPETQGYTAALLTLYLSALSLKEDNARIEEAGRFLSEDLKRVTERSIIWVQKHMEEFAQAEKLTIFGSGYNAVTASEGALKISETLKRVVNACEAEEFAHLVDLSFLKDDFCIALVHPELHFSRNIEIINLTRSITNHVFTISPHNNASVNDLELDCEIPLGLSPIAYVIPLQLLSAMCAKHLGIDTSRFPRDDIQGISHSEDYFLYHM